MTFIHLDFAAILLLVVLLLWDSGDIHKHYEQCVTNDIPCKALGSDSGSIWDTVSPSSNFFEQKVWLF